jgi:hypothetical protein
VPRGQRDGSIRSYSRFSRQEPLLFYQVSPQLYSRGWVDSVPDPLLFFLVVPWIEPGPPDLYPRTLTTRPQRRTFSRHLLILILSSALGRVREKYDLNHIDVSVILSNMPRVCKLSFLFTFLTSFSIHFTSAKCSVHLILPDMTSLNIFREFRCWRSPLHIPHFPYPFAACVSSESCFLIDLSPWCRPGTTFKQHRCIQAYPCF